MQFAAQVDNGVDVKFLELVNFPQRRLHATIQITVDLAKIRNAWDVDLLCKSELPSWRHGAMPAGTARGTHG